MKYLHFLIVLTLLVAVFSHCTAKKDWGSAASPIHIVVVPYPDLQKNHEPWQKFCAAWQRQTGLHMRCTVGMSYIKTIEQLNPIHGQAQIAILNPFSFFLAESIFKVKPIATATRHGQRPIYYSQFITLKENNITSLKDVQGKRVAFMNRFSTSGFIIPKIYLDANKIKPGSVVHSDSFLNSFQLLIDKKVDGIFTYSASVAGEPIPIHEQQIIIKKYPALKDKFLILQIPLAIPYETMVATKNLPSATIQALTLGLWQLSKQKQAPFFVQIDGFTRPASKTYENLKKYINSSSLAQEELVPDGIRFTTRYQFYTPGLAPLNQ